MSIAVDRTPHADEPLRDSIGGFAFLPASQPWPLCPDSGERMVLFIQLDVRAEWRLPIAAGSHLSIFMSPRINEPPGFVDLPPIGARLPDQFWTRRLQHFEAFLHPPGAADTASAEPDAYLEHRKLSFEPGGDSDIWIGEPIWYQDPEPYLGSAGDPMCFVMQIGEDVPFSKRPEAPEQPDSFSSSDYCLFLGNSVYVFADPAQPHPEALWITAQN